MCGPGKGIILEPMIAFASLFLALVFGVRPVEVVVGEGVASVELRLDGELRGDPSPSPLGDALRLRQRARPAASRSSGQRRPGARAQPGQPVDQPAAATGGRQRGARAAPARPAAGRPDLVAEPMFGIEPESVTASFDGEPLRVDDPRRIELPPADESPAPPAAGRAALRRSRFVPRRPHLRRRLRRRNLH